MAISSRDAYRAKIEAQGRAVRPYTRRNTTGARKTRRPKKDQCPVELALHQLFSAAAHRAAAARAPFAVSMADMHRMWDAQQGRCAVTDVPMTAGVGHEEFRVAPTRVSLDRILPRGAYTPENTRLVCWWYNHARVRFDDATVLEMARALVSAQGRV